MCPFLIPLATPAGDTLHDMMPDYMLVFAIALLAHDRQFTDSQDVVQLRVMERCLWLVMEPLLNNKTDFNYAFYKNLLDRMKNHKDSVRPDDDNLNRVSEVAPARRCAHVKSKRTIRLMCFSLHTPSLQKLWAICDIALHLLFTKTSQHDSRDLPHEPRIPNMYFQAQPADFSNTAYYLPASMYAADRNVPAVASRVTAVASRATAVVGRAPAATSKRTATRTAVGRRCHWSNKVSGHS